MAARVAALWLNEPGIRILGDHSDITMAIGAIHGEVLRHGIAQALSLRPGMAVITTLRIGSDIRCIGGVMMPVHGIGQALDITNWLSPSGIGRMTPITVHRLVRQQRRLG